MIKKHTKFIYDSNKENYTTYKRPFYLKVINAFAILCGIIVTAAITVWAVYKYVPSPGEQKMQSEQRRLQEQFSLIGEQLVAQEKQLQQLQKRDAIVYQQIFENTPIADSLTNIFDPNTFTKKLSPYSNAAILGVIQEQIVALNKKIAIQNTSYTILDTLIANKKEMLASIPSIQPIMVQSKDQISSGFGVRIDPIYKVPRLHTGLDFTAAIGTPIYATGNGKVTEVNYAPTGYGNYVRIAHGFGYETLYGHMVKAAVSTGTIVKRGQLIGYVGNTGKSTGPHVHYEVIKKDDKLDPIHFFYNDIKPAEYEQMVQQAGVANQSMD